MSLASDNPWVIYNSIIDGLRDARKTAEIELPYLARILEIPDTTVAGWELGSVEPEVDELTDWARALGKRPIIATAEGRLLAGPQYPLPGESGRYHMRRRLAVPLVERRKELRMAQRELAVRMSTSHKIVSLWENAVLTPAVITYITWTQVLGCTLVLRPRQ